VGFTPAEHDGRGALASAHVVNAPAVRLRSVSVVRGGRTLLDDVDWEVGSGSRWIVLGPNGSGKTTLLLVAGARLLPTGGTAEVLGERLGRVDMRVLRGRAAFVSGALARQLRPSLTAREVVVTGKDGSLEPHWRRVPDEDWHEADRALGRLRIVGDAALDGIGRPTGTHVNAGEGHGLGSRLFGSLSEGERQQVLIARALMGPAELLLLDEPAAGLDLGARERLVVRMAELADDPAVPALVLVTHHMEEIPPGFTHAALLREGRFVASGQIASVLNGESVSACFGARMAVGRRQGRWWATALP
jgi:iron complex transport system ATP-binding protein